MITRDDLKAELDAGRVTVVDALGGASYAKQHLPGAVALAPDEASQRAAAVLPDKSAAIVTYCSNPGCGNSEQVARTLAGLGYTHVRKYREGIEDWVEAGLPTEAA